MMVVARRGHALAGLTAVLVVHSAIVYLLLLGRANPAQAPVTRYSQLLFVMPPPPLPAAKTPEVPRIKKKTRPANPAVAKTPAVIQTAPPAETADPISQADPFAENPRIDIGSLVKQAGKADRETRPEKETGAYGPARDSMEAVMTRAFTAAKLAVPLKWYEAARIEEITAPGARKPIYQVKTAFGTYCLYYPDKLMEGTGQPKMAGCPRSIGR